MTISHSTLTSTWRTGPSSKHIDVKTVIQASCYLTVSDIITFPVMYPDQTDRGEPHRPVWREDSGCIWPAGDPRRCGCQHQPADSAERPETGGRLLPGNQSRLVWRNHHYQLDSSNNLSIISNQASGSSNNSDGCVHSGPCAGGAGY